MFAKAKVRLSTILLQAWYQGAKWLWVLWPFTLLYRILLRLLMLTSHKPPVNNVPVLVIGNITLGGTGKTPLVQALASTLREKNVRVGIISRGYGRASTAMSVLVNKDSTSAMVGDEPLLLFNACNVPVAVSSDKQAAIALLLAHHALDLIVSDDGLQNRHLQGDVEWLVIDGQRGLGNGHCLPMGPLREPIDRLQTVDAIWVTGTQNDFSQNDWHAQQGAVTTSDCDASQWQGVLPNNKPIVCVSSSLSSLHRVSDNQRVDWPTIDASQPIYAMAGIGHPQRFFDDLTRLGYAISAAAFADHHDFTQQDLQPYVDKLLIMTAKDAVKCQHILPSDNQSWYYAKQSVTIPPKAVTQLLHSVGLGHIEEKNK